MTPMTGIVVITGKEECTTLDPVIGDVLLNLIDVIKVFMHISSYHY